MMRRRTLHILLFLLLTTACFAQRDYECWIDNDYDSRIEGVQSADDDVSLSVDIGTLSLGLHFFNYHARNLQGGWGTLHRQAFIKGVTECSYEYWIDEDYTHRVTGTLVDGQLSANVDVSHLSSGVHLFSYRPHTEGISGTLTRHVFTISNEVNSYEYWFDENYAHRMVMSASGDSVTLAFDLNGLSPGVHSLSLRPRTSNGTVGPATSMLFVNELAVVAYEYWFDDDIANKVTANASGNNLQLPISVNHLSGDVHYLNFRAQHTDGTWGTLMRKVFVLKSNITGYDYSFGNDSIKHVDVASTELLVMDKQPFAIPEPKIRAAICDTTTIQIDMVTNTAMAIRRDTTDFSISFRNDEGRMSEVQNSEVAVVDTLLRQLTEIPLFGNIMVDKADSSDFRGFHINVPDSDTYMLAATDECRLFLYNEQAQRIEDIPLSMELLTLKAGRYYGIIYDMKGVNDSIMVSYAPENNIGDAFFDGLVATVSGERTLDEAFESVGGRSEASKTIAAVIWNKDTPLMNDLLQDITNPNLLVYVNEASLAPSNVQNVVVNGFAKNIVLTDVAEGNNNFYCPQTFTAESIRYIREFKQKTQVGVSRGWETIALPFTVQSIAHADKGAIAPFGVDNSERHFWLRQLTQQGLDRAMQIEANTPYLISMPNSDEYTADYNLNGKVTFSAQNAVVPVTEAVVTTYSDAGIEMVPAMQRVDRSSDVWALNVGVTRDKYFEGSTFERDYRMVRPFEAYTVHHGNNEGPAPRFVPIADMSGDATGMESLTPNPSLKGERSYYLLDGRKLQQKPSQKGVYILNGRKMVVK